MIGGAIAPIVPLVCTGPVKYRGEEALEARHRQPQGRRGRG